MRPAICSLVGEFVTEIKSNTVSTLGEDQEPRPSFRADDLRVLWPIRHPFNEHAANQVVWRVRKKFQAELMTDTRIAAVRSDNQSRRPFEALAIVGKCDLRWVSSFYSNVANAAQYRSASAFCFGGKHPAHGRMSHAEGAGHIWNKVSEPDSEWYCLLTRLVLVVGDVANAEDAAGIHQGVQQSQPLQLDDAPGCHKLSPHPVHGL